MYCQCQVSFKKGVCVCVWGGVTLVFYRYVGYAYFVGSEFQYFLCFQKKMNIYSFGRGGGGEGGGAMVPFYTNTNYPMWCSG